MGSMIDLQLFRDKGVIIESQPVDGMPRVDKWTVIGKNQEMVERATNALMQAAGDRGQDTASFTFPNQIKQKSDPKYKWFKATGYISNISTVDAHRLHMQRRKNKE